jgi:hypothetical protein
LTQAVGADNLIAELRIVLIFAVRTKMLLYSIPRCHWGLLFNCIACVANALLDEIPDGIIKPTERAARVTNPSQNRVNAALHLMATESLNASNAAITEYVCFG